MDRLARKAFGRGIPKPWKKTDINELRSETEERLKLITSEGNSFSRQDIKIKIDEIGGIIGKGKYEIIDPEERKKRAEVQETYSKYKVAKHNHHDDLPDARKKLDDAFKEYLEYLLPKLEKKAVGGVTQGWVADQNEDAYFIGNGSYGVFDGVAKRGHGDMASRVAKNFIESKLAKLPNIQDDAEAEAAIRGIFLEAHKAILEQDLVELSSNQNPSTTAAAIHIRKIEGEWRGTIVNAGDSRICILRKGSTKIEHLTFDNAGNSDLKGENPGYDPEVEKKAQQELADWEGGTMPKPDLFGRIQSRSDIRNVLGDKNSEPDLATYTYKFQPGDRIILFTDGIHDNLRDEETTDSLRANPFNNQKAAEDLIEKARQFMATDRSAQFEAADMNTLLRGGKTRIPGALQRAKPDDATVIIVQIGEN